MIDDQDANLKLRDIDKGNVIEQIDEYLAMAVADIADPNKKAEKARTVTATIIFSPSKSRREAEVTWRVDLKPSTHVEHEPSTIHLGKDSQGNPIAKPWIPNQPVLTGVEVVFDNEEDGDQAVQ